jgi:hypothetical protein
MTIGEETTIYVQLQIDVYGGCIELMSRDVPEAEARRMFSKVVADPRSVKEDIAALLATETRGDTLLLGYSAPGLRGRHGTVEFALEHAIDAAEKYFGFPADELRAALQPANVSALIDERERGMATLQDEFPELAELYKAFVDAVDDLRVDPPHEVTRDIALTRGALH